MPNRSGRIFPFFLVITFVAMPILGAQTVPAETKQIKESGGPVPDTVKQSKEPLNPEPAAVKQPKESAEAPAGVDTAIRMAQEGVRDPFENKIMEPSAAVNVVSAAAAQGPPPIPVDIQGIGLGPTSAYALLNGEIYYAGEEKGGIKLLEVRKGEVDILNNGTPQKLRMVSEEDIAKAQGRRLKKSEEAVSPV